MKKSLAAAAVFALAGCVLALAISSEPVYIKGHKNIQDFKSHLEKLANLMAGSPNLLGVQNPLASLIEGESGKFDAIRPGDETTRLEVTKIYRQLDASRKTLLTKGISTDHQMVAKIAETVKFIETLNNIKS